MQKGTKMPYVFLRILICVLICLGVFQTKAEAAEKKCKVLVVLSYHDDYAWQKEVRQGIEPLLAKKCTVLYFNLDTRNNPQNGPDKAREAHEVFLQYQPDGVLAVDDAAQLYFVVPYLKDKVSTPVVFAGVNNEASVYGYPASNVTGVLERFHTRETIALFRQLVPGAKTIGFLQRGGEPSTRGTYGQMKAEAESYPLKAVGFWEPTTYEEAIRMAEEIKQQADVIHVEQVEGLKDRNGRPYSNKELISKIAGIFSPKPLICGQGSSVRYGCLCSVVESGSEQGATGAKMLLQILNGTPVASLPVTRNYTGFKIINASVVKKLGLTPAPIILRGAKLVTDEN